MICLVLSTLPHYLSILLLYKYYNINKINIYIKIIFASSSLSVLYHVYEENNIIITYFDYTMAFIWFLYYLKILYNYLNKIICINAFIFIINISIPYNDYYYINHSIWHLLSAYKCYYTTCLIEI